MLEEPTLPIDTKTGEAIYNRIIEIAASVGELRGTSNEILKQTTTTNGRVSKLEEEVARLKQLKYWVWGLGAGLTVVFSLIYKIIELYKLVAPQTK